MRRLIHFAVWLYPPRWRHRYAREFEALLDDVEPGVHELFDVLKGALTMQIRTFGTILVLCALIGTTVGTFVAIRTPSIYSSSALMLLSGMDISNPESHQMLHAKLLGVLGQSKEELAATSLSVTPGNSGKLGTYLRLSYRSRDAIQAQRVTANLVTAIASNSAAPWSAVVVDSPVVPRQPIRPNYLVTILTGTIVGLIIGGIAVLILKLRRQSVSAH
jgi:hypothetical protein